MQKTPKLHSVQPSHGHFNPSFGSSFLQSSGQDYRGQPLQLKPVQVSTEQHKVNNKNIQFKSYLNNLLVVFPLTALQ